MVGNNEQPQPAEIKVSYSEDLPQNMKGISMLFSNCHKIRSLHVGWDPKERVLSLFCSECGRPVQGIKVERKGRIISV